MSAPARLGAVGLVWAMTLGCGGSAPRVPGVIGEADAVVLLQSPIAQFAEARALAVDAQGAVYVADAGAETVTRLDSEGVVLERWGGPGTADGAFQDVSDVAVGEGLLLSVADAGNHRVQRFGRGFLHLASLPVGGEGDAATEFAGQYAEGGRSGAGRPTRVVLDAAGTTYALDADAGHVAVWDADLRRRPALGQHDDPAGPFADPVDLAVDAGGRLLVADRVASGRTQLRRYDAFGTPLGLSEVDAEIVALTFAENGTLWAATPHGVLATSAEGAVRAYSLIEANGGLAGELVGIAVAGGRLYVLTPSRLFVTMVPTG